MPAHFRVAGLALLVLGMASTTAFAQRSRITERIDNTQRMTLRGHINPRANAANDRGRVAPSLELSYVTLTLTQTDAQKADLATLLSDLQNPSSPNYHKWLTPAQYADRFGVSPADLSSIEQWLRGQGLTVVNIAQARNWIAIRGTAAQVESAFATELHQYAVNGETHFANASEPSVPAAIGGIVRSIRGLNDFRMKPASVKSRASQNPHYTSAHGNHYLSPNDLAAIYDISPAYAAGINGSGQSIVVAGQSTVNLADIQTFQTAFNLQANLPTLFLVPGSRRPDNSDEGEADLDLEWSGAVARNAAITFVYSENVMDAVLYAIDHNLAPVISLSYGSCEPEDPSDAPTFQSWAQQANIQGITWVNATGDNGAADCNDSQNPGLSVDLPSSIPEITGMGGTEFTENGGAYWNAANDANSASVLSYIPETAWNDSAADGSPSASGGGSSIYFGKPSWQTGPGVPGDNARHVPDIAMSASADHDGYLVYSAGDTLGSPEVFGGTSVPTPVFAGVIALLNQYTQSAGQGNINPKLYSLAQTSPSVFHDITTGDNIVTVSTTNCPRRQTCPTQSPVGYTAGVGYDPVTGLGSMDIWNLITCWSGSCATVTPPPSTSLSLLSNLDSVGPQDVAFLTATATSNNGVTPVGAVTFAAGTTSLGSATLTGWAGTATATLAVTGGQLPSGLSIITASFNGGAGSTAVTQSVTMNVRTTGSSSNGTPSIMGLTDGASYQQRYSPGMVLTVFGAALSPSIESASAVPLPVSMSGVEATINDEAAPLYYVSPTQLNIQIPYETPVNSTATLKINNSGVVTTQTFTVVAATPGIFTDQNRTIVPSSSAAMNSVATMFITGAGAVTPAIATGAAPASTTPLASLPAPAPVTVSVGGKAASTICEYCFVGIPWGLAGVAQINFQIPAGLAVGPQPVVVTVGGVQSTAANINITN
ncbi:MAG TPA: protease pro-enzyme activation domain-containing protein [Bryobacteraceae bacterium]|nr:protease pro-enzyme activation domain-containing protein [Bryobacteraceae bacterium]